MALKHHIYHESNDRYLEYSRVEQVKMYVSKNIASDLCASVVSEKFELSISSLQHLFKKYQGQSYQRYLEDSRMKKAFGLITREGKRISEAMYATGYHNRSTFNNAFKKKFKSHPLLVQAYKKFSGASFDLCHVKKPQI